MKRPLNQTRHVISRTRLSLTGLFLALACGLVVFFSVSGHSESLSPPQWIGIYQQDGAVNLRWFRVQGAVTYSVLRRTDTEEKFREIGRVRNPVFTDHMVPPDQVVHYQIIPFDAQGVRGPLSEQRYIRTAPAVPRILGPPEWSVVQVRKDGFALTWSHKDAKSVLAYNLYRKKEGEKDFVLIFSTRETNYLDRNLTPGSTYQYILTAFNQMLVESPHSDPMKMVFPLPAEALAVAPRDIRDIKVLEEVVNPTELLRVYSWEDYGFVSPVDVEFWAREERLYVSDSGTDQVVVVGRKNEVLQTLGGRGWEPWKFQRLLGIAVDDYGYVYAVDAYRAGIVVFDPNGSFERRIDLVPLLREYYGAQFGEEYPGRRFGLVDLVIDGWNNLILTDNPNGKIYVISPDGKLLDVIGGRGPRPGELQYPTFLDLLGDGSYVVADSLNSRLQVFTPSGEPDGVIGEKGLGIGQFIRPKGVTGDGNGFLFVADSFSNSVQVFSENGDFVALLANEEGLPLDLGSPNGLVFSEPDQLFICEKLARRIQVRRVLVRKDLPWFTRVSN